MPKTLTREEKLELQRIHRKLYGGDWGKPKSVPYILRRLDDVLAGYRDSLPFHSRPPESALAITWVVNHGAITGPECRKFVHYLCRLLVCAAQENEKLQRTFWDGRDRSVASRWRWPLLGEDLKLWDSWWEVFREVATKHLSTIPPLPNILCGVNLPPWPEIPYLES